MVGWLANRSSFADRVGPPPRFALWWATFALRLACQPKLSCAGSGRRLVRKRRFEPRWYYYRQPLKTIRLGLLTILKFTLAVQAGVATFLSERKRLQERTRRTLHSLSQPFGLGARLGCCDAEATQRRPSRRSYLQQQQPPQSSQRQLFSQQQASPQHVQEQASSETLAGDALGERIGKTARAMDFNVIGKSVNPAVTGESRHLALGFVNDIIAKDQGRNSLEFEVQAFAVPPRHANASPMSCERSDGCSSAPTVDTSEARCAMSRLVTPIRSNCDRQNSQQACPCAVDKEGRSSTKERRSGLVLVLSTSFRSGRHQSSFGQCRRLLDRIQV